MAKLKVQEATKELSLNASKLLENVTRIRRSADATLSQLKQIEQTFVRAEEERLEREKLQRQREALESQSNAWIMPEEAEPAPKAEAPAAEAPAKEAAPAEKPQPETVKEPAAEKPVSPAPAKQEAAAQEKPAAPKPVQQPAATAAPQSAQRPQQRLPVQQGARPQQPGQPVNRPANAQGPYGRPANPQGPYGRPANPQSPYGRPANPQGPYGRPANPQGPYGRPANPQGPYGRPAGGAPQGGGYGNRPAGGAPRPGGFGGGAAGGMGGNRGRSRGPELTPTVEKERVSNYDPNKKMYQRQHDPEQQRGNSRHKGGVRETGIMPGDDEMRRGGSRKKGKQVSAQQMMAPIKIEKAYMTAETITVKDLTERIGKPAGDIIKKLLLLGIMATINQELDYDTASLVCSEFGVDLELKLDKTAEDTLAAENFEDAESDLVERPPVVTIMGHVDHGKTTLLDYIRKSHVTAGEAGGITQHIGAYQVNLNGRLITFLDTPGHEAFTAMRMRGAQATDIAILVVAADDGVMPQTIEAINHAKAANVPIIVAINKMDKEGANPDRIKQDLTNYNLVCEEWGGDTIMVPISAAKGDNIDTLLEMILLEADMLQLKANPNRQARGIIIEARLDKGRGPVATVLVQNGTLHVGDTVVAGMAYGRVRAMMNERGERVKAAPPSTPVEVIGFGDVPEAGDEINAVEDTELSRKVAEERRSKQRAAMIKASSKVSLDDLFTKISEGELKDLNLIIKADVQGSVEAVKQSLERLSNDQVRVRTIHGSVGAITENDVMLASTAGAIIIGFNVRPENNARDMAAREGVDIRLYRIIYNAIEDVEKAMKGLLAPEFREVILGHAQVRNTFRISGVGTIAGCYVTDGKLQRNAQVRLLRDNVVVFEGNLDSLRRFKDDVKEISTGYECGVGLEKYNDVKENDVIECFTNEQVER
ncbi:MAG: translation initiation factor IF-2 [Candidatus Aphodomonas sp.]|nr:translation initiation factor IF-2 [Candidatus Aphodomonas sp.]